MQNRLNSAFLIGRFLYVSGHVIKTAPGLDISKQNKITSTSDENHTSSGFKSRFLHGWELNVVFLRRIGWSNIAATGRWHHRSECIRCNRRVCVFAGCGETPWMDCAIACLGNMLVNTAVCQSLVISWAPRQLSSPAHVSRHNRSILDVVCLF